jgi:F-type H+-transporting ATPase subunit epsilon
MTEIADTTIHLEISAPERDPVEVEVSEVLVPGAYGSFTVLPGHTPLLSTLTIGVLVAYPKGARERFYAVNQGFVEVVDNKVTVLTQTAEHAEEVDVERAQQARERALERLSKRRKEIDALRAELALSRAMARISAHSRTSM